MDPTRQEKDFDWTECDIFLAQLQLTLFVVYLGLKKLGKRRAVVSFAGNRGNVGVSRDGKRDTFSPPEFA